MNSIRFVGLDVHRESIRACIRDGNDDILSEHSLGCTRDEIESFARSRLARRDVVALEATFHSWAIVDLLAPHVGRVVVSNPLATKAIADAKIKTDKIDARVLSELLRLDYLPEVWTPDAATRERRATCARRAGLVSDVVRIKNRIHGVLAKTLVPKRKGDLFDRKGRLWLESLDLPEHARRQLESDLRLLGLAERELGIHEAELVRGAWDDPRVKLLVTMPGVDVTVALAILAAIGDVDRFRDGDRLAAYLGLVPSTYQSGERCYHGHITKRGNCKARWLLIQAAQHLAGHPGPLGVFFRRIEKHKNRNVAVVATARKLAVIAWRMLTTGEPYRYALPKPTSGKLARFRTRATGARRKGGNPKGAPRHPNYGTGVQTRTIPALPTVYAGEGVPLARPPDRLAPGERRMLEQNGASPFVQSIQSPEVRPRKLPKNSGVQCAGAVHDATST